MILGLILATAGCGCRNRCFGGCLEVWGVVILFKRIGSLLPVRSLLFLLTENNVGGIAWAWSLSFGYVPLILNAHIEEGLYHNLFEIYRPSYVCFSYKNGIRIAI